jgi:hypothetical protein
MYIRLSVHHTSLVSCFAGLTSKGLLCWPFQLNCIIPSSTISAINPSSTLPRLTKPQCYVPSAPLSYHLPGSESAHTMPTSYFVDYRPLKEFPSTIGITALRCKRTITSAGVGAVLLEKRTVPTLFQYNS